MTETATPKTNKAEYCDCLFKQPIFLKLLWISRVPHSVAGLPKVTFFKPRCVPQKVSHFYFHDNSGKCGPISTFFSLLHSVSIKMEVAVGANTATPSQIYCVATLPCKIWMFNRTTFHLSAKIYATSNTNFFSLLQNLEESLFGGFIFS